MAATNIDDGKNIQEKDTRFSCGGCESFFEDLYLLHNHMRDHVEGGSFNYKHTIRTAFPVSVSINASTQTDDPLEESMTNGNDDVPFSSTEDVQESDPIDTKMYQLVKTEVADFVPVTFAFDDTDQFISDIVRGSSKAADAQEQDTSTKMEIENIEETSGGIPSNEVTPRKRGRPRGSTKLKEPGIRRMDVEDTIVKCERCKVLVTIKKMRRHLLVYHNDQNIYKVTYKKKKPKKTYETTKVKITKPKGDKKRKAKISSVKHKGETSTEKDKSDTLTEENGETLKENHEGEKSTEEHKNEASTEKQKHKSDTPKVRKSHKKKKSVGEKREKQKAAKQDIVCQICGKNIKTRRILRRHIKVVHEKVKPLMECETCGKKVQNLKLHVQNMHINQKKPGPSICETCGRVFPNGLSLARHKIVHTEKYLTCRYCSYQSSTHEEFQAHLKMHKRAKVYSCHICPSKFNTPGNIHKHIRSIHMGERRHFCDVCQKGFYTKGHLKAHRAIHFEPTLKCRFCDRLFKEDGSRRIHERIHKCDQRYRCHICDHGFVQAGCYWSHMLKRHSIPKEQAIIIRQQQMAADSSLQPNKRSANPLRPKKPFKSKSKSANLYLSNENSDSSSFQPNNNTASSSFLPNETPTNLSFRPNDTPTNLSFRPSEIATNLSFRPSEMATNLSFRPSEMATNLSYRPNDNSANSSYRSNENSTSSSFHPHGNPLNSAFRPHENSGPSYRPHEDPTKMMNLLLGN